MNGRSALPELLHRSGTGVIFSMLGGSNVGWIAEGVESRLLRLIRTRHEETAVNAAVGFARATGTLGVCSVTRGPGFANAVNALTDATQSHVPLLLLVGQSPPSNPAASQRIDQRGITAAIGSGFHHVDASGELEPVFWGAVRDAWASSCPQVVSIADDVLDADVALSSTVPEPRARPTAAAEAVGAAVDALAEADRPLLLAGSGALVADCREELEELAELTGALVASTLRANRFFSGNPRDLGICGSWSPGPVREMLRQADVVAAFGASLNQHTTANRTVFGGATLIQCELDEDQPFHASRPELALLGDARTTARAMIDEWHRRALPDRPAWDRPPTAKAIRRAITSIDLGHDPARGIDLRDAYVAFDGLLSEDRVIVTDSGGSLGTLPSLVDARDARSWLVGRGYGSIGLGLGLAIGAAVAHPDRPVVLFTGDGGFMMAAQDLDAVRLNGLDLTVVIMNDEQYGSDVRHLVRHGLVTDIARLTLPDVELLAAAFGGTGTVVRTLAELSELEVPHSGLALLDVRIDPGVDGRSAF